MSLLLYGILLWVLLHAIPIFAREIRASIIGKIGQLTYRIIFGSMVLVSLAIIIFGFIYDSREIYYIPFERAADITYMFVYAAIFLTVLAFVNRAEGSLFVASFMLFAMVLWSVGHLIANGDSASVTLFSSSLIWSLAMLILVRIRDGYLIADCDAVKPTILKSALISLIVFAILGFLHPYVIGVVAFNFYPFM